MDMIEKALQKAKQKKSQSDATASVNEVDQQGGEANASRIDPPAQAEPPVQSGKSKHTKQIGLNQKILEANYIVTHDIDDPRTKNYDVLRTSVLHAMQRCGARTLAVTSPTAACGKTVTAINLAFSMARNIDHTVLLADFDLRSPSIAKYMGLDVAVDLSDYLSGTEELADVLVSPSVDRLVVLPNRRPVRNASDILSSKGVHDAVQAMSDRYSDRKIIFDLPPLMEADDVQAFLPCVDAVLLVVRCGDTTSAQLEEAKQKLEGHNIIAIALNDVPVTVKNYYGEGY